MEPSKNTWLLYFSRNICISYNESRLYMEGYYTGYAFVVLDYEGNYDEDAKPVKHEFATYEDACEYYGKIIDIIQSH